jgi:hypothetical protein
MRQQLQRIVDAQGIGGEQVNAITQQVTAMQNELDTVNRAIVDSSMQVRESLRLNEVNSNRNTENIIQRATEMQNNNTESRQAIIDRIAQSQQAIQAQNTNGFAESRNIQGNFERMLADDRRLTANRNDAILESQQRQNNLLAMQSLVNMTHRQGRGGEKKKSELELLKRILEPDSLNQSLRDQAQRFKKRLDEDLEAGARIADESDAEQGAIRTRQPPANVDPLLPVTQFSKRGEASATPNPRARRVLQLPDDTMGAAGGARRPFGQIIPNFTGVAEVSEVSA